MSRIDVASMTGHRLAALWLCLFVIGSAEVVAGPIMQVMGDAFGVPASAVAYLPAAYGLAYAVIASIAGPISDRWGRKWPLMTSLSAFSLLCGVLPSSGSLATAIALSAALGMMAAIIQPVSLSLVSDVTAPADMARRIGQVFIGLMTAFIVTPVVSGLVAARFGWQTSYHILALLAAIAAVLVARLFPADRAMSRAPVTLLAMHRGALGLDEIKVRLAASFLWLGWMAGIGAVAAEIARRKLQTGPAEAGAVAAFWGALIMAGNLSGHRIEKRLAIGALPIMAGMAAIGVLALMLPVTSAVVLAGAGAIWAFGYGCAGPLHHARLSNLSEDYRGTVNSYHASLLNLGIFSVSSLYALTLGVLSLNMFIAAVATMGLAGAFLLIMAARLLGLGKARSARS
ncbi:major facilitator transporter [Sphingobium sp. MI1205]|nr:major facilitator transporter [Sphingobium sp. MI1205]